MSTSKQLKCVSFSIMSHNISWHKLPASVSLLNHRYRRDTDTNWVRGVELDQLLRSKATGMLQVLPLVSLENTELHERKLPKLVKIMVTSGNSLIDSDTIRKLAELLRPTMCHNIVFVSDFASIHRFEWQQLFSSAVYLTSLTFDCHIEYESNDVLSAIASNCPYLSCLRLIALESVTDPLFSGIQQIRLLASLEIESTDQVDYEDVQITIEGVSEPLAAMFNGSLIDFRFFMGNAWNESVGSALIEFAAERQLHVKHFLDRMHNGHGLVRVGLHMRTQAVLGSGQK